jgi:hypothetical protein
MMPAPPRASRARTSAGASRPAAATRSRERARDDLKNGEYLAAARIEAEEASARLDVLRDAVGAKVEELNDNWPMPAAVDVSDGALNLREA